MNYLRQVSSSAETLFEAAKSTREPYFKSYNHAHKKGTAINEEQPMVSLNNQNILVIYSLDVFNLALI